MTAGLRSVATSRIPESQGEVVCDMINWFATTLEATPVESTVRRRVQAAWRELTRPGCCPPLLLVGNGLNDFDIHRIVADPGDLRRDGRPVEEASSITREAGAGGDPLSVVESGFGVSGKEFAGILLAQPRQRPSTSDPPFKESEHDR